MGMQLTRHGFLMIVGLVGNSLVEQVVGVQPEPPARTTSATALPLSTRIIPNRDFGYRRVVPTKAHWNGREFDIETGIQVMMAVIKDPTTTTDERALALRHLGNLNTNLQGRPCIDDLVALYPKLETGEGKYRLLFCLLSSEDSRGLPLAYSVANGDAKSRLRHRAAAALARWNIRRGVEVLIALFPDEEKGLLRTRGAGALMTFKSFNRTKGWGCPVEDILNPAIAMSKHDHDAAVALAQSGFSEWFEANKERFPDWKPGDPLPEVSKVKGKPDADK